MLRLVIPLVLALVGAGAGIGAGLMLRPAPDPEAAGADMAAGDHGAEGGDGHAAPAEGGHGAAAADDGHGAAAADDGHGGGDGHGDTGTVFVKLNNQFIVPVLEGGRIVSLVVLTLSIETTPDGQQIVFQREPKLRDSFLQVLFDHANAGGFSGNFTSGDRLDTLRTALLRTAQRDVGDLAIRVLVTDIARRDT